MIKTLKRGIVSVLVNEFELPVFVDDHEQDDENEHDFPCFLVTTLTNTENHVVMERNKRNHAFMVQYIPKEENTDECEEIADRLMDILRIIPLHGSYIRNKGEIDAHIVDGILNVEVKYEYFVMRKNRIDLYEFEKMEQLDINQTMKGADDGN